MEVSVEVPRRRSIDSSSPEFEFWVVGNHPSSPPPHLLTADELFVDGFLLPLQLLSLPSSIPDPEPKPQQEPQPEPEHYPSPDPPPVDPSVPSASIFSSAAAAPSVTGSKRWKDIFKIGEKKAEEKERRKERKNSSSGSAELNINIWPFSRSHSAGNGGARPRTAAMAGRKISSAPCSRSNSRGESSKPTSTASGPRRWAASPGRAGLAGGVHLGRTSPVWQLRRPDKAVPKEKPVTGGGRKGAGGGAARVLSLNVNTCIGYRNQVSCRGDDNDSATASAGGGDRTVGNGSLFNIRSLFSKKVY